MRILGLIAASSTARHSVRAGRGAFGGEVGGVARVGAVEGGVANEDDRAAFVFAGP